MLGVDARDLLDLPTDRIVAAQVELASVASTERPGMLDLRLVPVVDGTVLHDPPLEALADDVAVMTGTTHDECTLFLLMAQAAGDLPDAKLVARCSRLFGQGRGHKVADAYRAQAGGSNGDAWCAVLTDLVFRIPSIRLAEALLAQGQSDVWMYRFDHPSSAFGGALKACHAIEIPFVFDNLHRRGVEQFVGPVDDDMRSLATAVSDAWLAFAHGRNPGWPAYDVEKRATMLFQTPPTVVEDPDGSTRELCEGVA